MEAKNASSNNNSHLQIATSRFLRLMNTALGSIFYRIASEKQVLWSLLIRFSSAFLLLATSVVLARTLGIENFGIYSFAVALITILQLPATAGTFTLVLRETASGLARSDHAHVKGVWNWSMAFVTKLSLTVLVITAIAIATAASYLGNQLAITLLIAALTIPILAFARLFSARLRGIGLVVVSQVPEQLLRPALLIVLIAITAQLTGNITSITAVFLYSTSAILGLLIVAAAFYYKQPPELSGADGDFQFASRWRRALIGLTMLSGLQVLTPQVALILLGIMDQIESVSEMKLATSMTVFGIFTVQVINFVFGPRLSRAQALGDIEAMQSLAKRAVGLGTLGSAPVLLVLALGASPIIEVVYGEQYLRAVTAVRILSFAYLIRTVMGPCGLILTMTNNEASAVHGHLVGLLLALALLILLAPRLGVTGAAIAVGAGLVFTQAYMLTKSIQLAQVDSSLHAVLRHYKAS